MNSAGKVCAVVVLVALASAVAEAQAPIRIGATLSQTGEFAAPGQSQLRGHQLCVKQLPAMAAARFSSRPSGTPGRWIAGSSATPS